jgi:hypothetical protein
VVNTSTNINSMNNFLSHQIIEYQQKKKEKKTTAFAYWNPDPGLGQAHKCGIVKQVNRIPIKTQISNYTWSVYQAWTYISNVKTCDGKSITTRLPSNSLTKLWTTLNERNMTRQGHTHSKWFYRGIKGEEEKNVFPIQNIEPYLYS